MVALLWALHVFLPVHLTMLFPLRTYSDRPLYANASPNSIYFLKYFSQGNRLYKLQLYFFVTTLLLFYMPNVKKYKRYRLGLRKLILSFLQLAGEDSLPIITCL